MLKKGPSNSGFTLIELMVVVSVMVILAAVMTINLTGQRTPRNIKIAQNELVTNIRKVQSYTLSARNLSAGQSVQYYLIKFDLSKPNQYTIQAVFDRDIAPKLKDVETVTFPSNIQLAGVNPISVARSKDPTTQNISGSGACALVAFVAPFAKIIFNDGCSPINSSASPILLNLTDDYYQKIINFQTNTACALPANPPICTASTDSIMTITLTDTANSTSKTVIVNAITGSVSFN